MKRFKIAFSALVFALSLLSITPSYAGNGQGNNGNGGGNGGAGSPSLPINNGILFLLLAGTVIGAKVIYSSTKKVQA